MTGTGLAALIAAIAFAVLVVYLCLVLKKLSGVLLRLHTTVDKANEAIGVVTKDVDQLSIEVEGLLNKVNTLVDDINGKLEKTDPLFTAIGDVGESVSGIQASTKKVSKSLSSAKLFKSVTPFGTKETKGAKGNKEKAAVTSHAKTSTVKPTVKTSEKSKLDALVHKQPSKTAGEITIKKRG